MQYFVRGIFLVGLLLIVAITYYFSTYGVGLKGVHNKTIINKVSRECPGEVDEFGNCLVRNYRSAYYREYYFDNSSYGRGK